MSSDSHLLPKSSLPLDRDRHHNMLTLHSISVMPTPIQSSSPQYAKEIFMHKSRACWYALSKPTPPYHALPPDERSQCHWSRSSHHHQRSHSERTPTPSTTASDIFSDIYSSRPLTVLRLLNLNGFGFLGALDPTVTCL